MRPRMASTNPTRLTPMELSSFCAEIALMLGAGMPLYSGMEALKETHAADDHAALYTALAQSVQETGSLAEALRQTKAWPRYLVEMCAIGERTGHLEQVMQGLSAYYERESRILRAVRSAIAYPLVLGCMVALIVLVLVVSILPVFRRVLGSMGVAMSAPGSMLMRMGTIIGWVVLAVVGVALLASLAILLLLRTRRREGVLRALRAAFPPLRRVSARMSSARVATVLSMMLSSGFPLEEGLSMVPMVLDDQAAAAQIAAIRDKLAQGVSFSDALTGSRLFDEVHNQMIRMGIAAGREDQVMAKLAAIYEEETETGVDRLVSIIEPTMVALLSIVIGAILLSVMLPMAGVIASIL